ncbi:uncharacterized protein [Haliotis cracherodii]|uniref:uncharacterized protein n=1 Tax=Haliotis cracherodii TaxID=6455 RepID=UPI0039ED0049
MASRIQFTGSITPSGTGLLRFVIHDVTAADAGQYECYRGSMSSRGARIPDCGQELAVLGSEYIWDIGEYVDKQQPFNNDESSYSCGIGEYVDKQQPFNNDESSYSWDIGEYVVKQQPFNNDESSYSWDIGVYVDKQQPFNNDEPSHRWGIGEYVVKQQPFNNDEPSHSWNIGECVDKQQPFNNDEPSHRWGIGEYGVKQQPFNNDEPSHRWNIGEYGVKQQPFNNDEPSNIGEYVVKQQPFNNDEPSYRWNIVEYVVKQQPFNNDEPSYRWNIVEYGVKQQPFNNDESSYSWDIGEYVDKQQPFNNDESSYSWGIGEYVDKQQPFNNDESSYSWDIGEYVVKQQPFNNDESSYSWDIGVYVDKQQPFNNDEPSHRRNIGEYVVKQQPFNIDEPSHSWNIGECVDKQQPFNNDEPSHSWNIGECVDKQQPFNNDEPSHRWGIGEYGVKQQPFNNDEPSHSWGIGEYVVKQQPFNNDEPSHRWNIVEYVVNQQPFNNDEPSHRWNIWEYVVKQQPFNNDEPSHRWNIGEYVVKQQPFNNDEPSYSWNIGEYGVKQQPFNNDEPSYSWNIGEYCVKQNHSTMMSRRTAGILGMTTTEHARYGGYATLSWPLPAPGIKEFTVCNSGSTACLLQITDFTVVNTTGSTSRVRFVGSLSSSGPGLFRCLLYNVTWEDEGEYKCYSGSSHARGSIIPDCGQRLTVLTATTAYARYGETASLTLKVPKPRVKEFTVRRLSTHWGYDLARGPDLFHVTNYHTVYTTNTYESRALYTGNITTPGSGVFTFLLDNVRDLDGGEYQCLVNQSGSGEARISDCGQKLVVLETEEPYIVATDRLRAGSISLTCHVILHPSFHCHPEVSVTWRRNGATLTGEYHVAVETWSWGHNYCSYYSTLHVRWRQGDRYKCHGVVERTLVSVWSEEHVLGTAWLESDASYTVVREGNNATLTWKIPLQGRKVSIRAPNRKVLLYMELTNVFPPYKSSVKIVGVVSSPAAVVVRLRLSNVTAADAGVYFCRDTRPPGWQHTLFVSRTPTNPIMVYSQFQQMTLLTCLSISRTLPEHRQLKLSYRWRRNSPHLEHHVLGFIGPSVLIRKEDNDTTYLCQAEEEGLVSHWTSDRTLYELFITDLTVNNTKTVVVEDGWTLRFKCNVTGYPRASAHIVNHETRGVYALSDRLQDVILTNINASHHGQYTCSAVNMIGVTHGDDHPVFVKVKSSPVRTDSGNVSLTLTYNKYVMTGTFLIRGYPEPKLNKMYFSRDGNTTVDISNRRRPKISVNPVRDNLFKFTFTITEVLKTELGTYRISIDNEIGAVDIYIKLLGGELSTSRHAVSYVPHVKGASMDDIGQIVCSPSDLRESETNNDEDDVQEDTVVIHQEPDKDVLTNDVQDSDLPDAEPSSGHPTVEMN